MTVEPDKGYYQCIDKESTGNIINCSNKVSPLSSYQVRSSGGFTVRTTTHTETSSANLK